jgi:fermentation-respiration switch protein FrsA (DUF1100 family)
MIAGALLAAGAIAVGAWEFITRVYLPKRLVHQPRHGTEYWRGTVRYVHPSELGLTYEDVSFTSRDGLRLVGWYFPATQGSATVIALHGIGGSRITMLGTAAWLVACGYSVLAYDSRAAGESEGVYCTFGYHEKYDVVSAMEWVRARKGPGFERIGLLGKSMGGAIALQAAPIEPSIMCIIAESPFAELRTISRDYQKRILGFDIEVIHTAAARHAERLAKFRIDDVSPTNAVAHTNVPLMFVHGTDDRLVSASYSEILFATANGIRELYLVPGGGHGGLYDIAGEEYNSRRLDFLHRHLDPA